MNNERKITWKNGDDYWEMIVNEFTETYSEYLYSKNGVQVPLLEVIKMEIPIVIEDLKKCSQGIPFPEVFPVDTDYTYSLWDIRTLCLCITNMFDGYTFDFRKESSCASSYSSEQKAFIKDLQSLLEDSLEYDEGEIDDDYGNSNTICILGYRQNNAGEVATRLENIWKKYQSII